MTTISNNLKWHRDGNNYYYLEPSTPPLGPILPNGIYDLKGDGGVIPFYLEKRPEEEFTFNHKLYSMEEDLIERCKKTFNHIPGNMGIILTGYKGTGKSICAKRICNVLERPVIVISTNKDCSAFLSSIVQEITIVIDEYEKIFGRGDSLLTLMDGIHSNRYKRAFILTTNNNSVSDFLINRPGRIRYMKEFFSLDAKVIAEIVKDLLVDKSKTKQVVSFLASVNHLTMDIVKSIIEEVNVHGDDDLSCYQDFLNIDIRPKYVSVQVQQPDGSYKDEYHMVTVDSNHLPEQLKDIYPSTKGNSDLIDGEAATDDLASDGFHINNRCIGYIQAVENDGTLVLNKQMYPEEEENEEKGPSSSFKVKIVPLSSVSPVVFKNLTSLI